MLDFHCCSFSVVVLICLRLISSLSLAPSCVFCLSSSNFSLHLCIQRPQTRQLEAELFFPIVFFSVLFELIKINAIISMEINFTIYFIYKSCYFSFFAALAEAGWGHIFGKKNVKQKSTKKVLNSHWENGVFFLVDKEEAEQVKTKIFNGITFTASHVPNMKAYVSHYHPITHSLRLKHVTLYTYKY